MQITELENAKLKRSYKIVVDAARINQEMEAELKRAGQRVKLPGFRPGNIPLNVLRQRFGKTVQPDVLKNVINDATADMMEEKKFRPAMMPQINIETYPEDGELTFTVAFEVLPDLPELSFDGITLPRDTFEIAESDIDEAVARVAEANPTLEPAASGAKAKMGQVLTIDFKGMIDGKAFDGGSAEDFDLELGSKRFIDTFEEQLVGTKEGDDIIVKVTFPKDYQAKNLAGKEASFAVKVKKINDKVTPAADDEFAKTCGFDDIKALREAIRGQMTKEYGSIVRRNLKKVLFDTLEKSYDFDLPQGMVDLEFGAIWDKIKQGIASGDEAFKGKSEEALKEEYTAIARRRVKLGLILAEVGQRNKIRVTNEEMNRAVMEQASQFRGQEKRIFDFYRDNPQQLNQLRGPILEEKAVDFILGAVKYNDTSVSLKDLENAEAEDAADDGEAKPKAKGASKSKSKKKSEAAE